MKQRVFVTGISTEVGKTLAAAILTEALAADYWKPVQAGDLDDTDSHKVAQWVSNGRTTVHPNAYALTQPMSPHAAAERDGVKIELQRILPPETDNALVIEGAGGLLVPLNDRDTIAELIRPEYKVVVVSRHYLGSINHSLLTLEALRARGISPYLLFNGAANPDTENIIASKTGVPVLGRIPPLAKINRGMVRQQADALLPALETYNFL